MGTQLNFQTVQESLPPLYSDWLRFVGAAAGSRPEWKDAEDRFDRLASTVKGSVLAAKASDFGFCIGLHGTPEFANELLGALRGRRDQNTEITKAELYSHWCRITHPCFNTRLQVFFELFDRNMDGRLTAMEIKQAILLSASTNKLCVTHEEAEQYATLIMAESGSEARGFIKLSQLETLFKACSSKRGLPCNQILTLSTPHGDDPHDQEPMSKIDILFRTYWRRGWMVLGWLIVCFALFAWKFTQYRHRKAFEVMGFCLCTAKGAAETLKFNMALILLPVCRITLTWLRNHRSINAVVPFNDNINFHKLIAGGIVVGVILHGGTHLACDFPRISGSDRTIFRQTIAVHFGYRQPSYIQILATTEVATGIAMVILMTIAFLLATKLPRSRSPLLPRSVQQVTGFNAFWYSHHLFIFVYALLIVHSMFLFLTNDPTEKTAWMYIAIPVLLYGGERILRAIRSTIYDAEILKASVYTGKVLSLKMRKPEGFRYLSGMYISVQCPQISAFEWHPFSLTSGPEDNYLSVHIRTLGDWSYQLYSLFQETILSGAKEYPKIYIDGPYGAASQDHAKYEIVVLIGLGIGATPFLSILKDVINGLHRIHCDHVDSRRKGPSKAYLYWVTREQGSFDWFGDIMQEITRANQKQSVIEMYNFLSSAYQEGDARSALLSTIQALYHTKIGIDIVSRTPVRTHFGRPNWFTIFSNLAYRHRGAQIGVFYCGPSALARELGRLCTKFSTKTTTRFVFHKENY